MLIKKLGTIAATGALLLAVAAPAFADVSVDNSAGVVVTSVNVANTGYNTVSAHDEGSANGVYVETGSATASNTVGTEVNNNSVYVNDTTGGRSEVGEVSVSNCGFTVVTVDNVANTGHNTVSVNGEDDAAVSGSQVHTGNASAGSNVQTLVNVNSVSVTASGNSRP